MLTGAEHGTALPLVLLHGWGFNAAIWQPLRRCLPDALTVHTPDLPGYGASPAVAGGLAEIAGRVLAAAPPRAVWLGWSLGGLIAWQAALRAPERIAGIVAVAANPCFVMAEDWPGIPARILDEFARDLDADVRATLRRFVFLQSGTRGDRTQIRALNRMIAAGPAPARETLVQGLRVLRDTDLRVPLEALRIPVTTILGARDTLVPITVRDALHRRYPRWRSRVLAGAGHAPFLADPQGFAGLLTETVAAMSAPGTQVGHAG